MFDITCCRSGLMPVGLLIMAVLASSCSSEYKKYVDNPGKQVASILRSNGCLDCHSTSAKAPFYADFPVIGSWVKTDMTEGTRYLDLTRVVKALENDDPVTIVEVAKLENTALSASMPPKQYSHVHWGTSLSGGERDAIIKWAKQQRKANFTTPTVAEVFANEPLQPLMASLETDPAKVALGFDLYHDTRLSGDNTVSCASCHGLDMGGVDRKQFSEGIRGQKGGVNAPTVYNSALNFVQFWDGRAADLKEQAAGPPLNPVEMGSESFEEISAKLESDPTMKQRFKEIYGDEGINQSTITDAIAEFEKTLLTPSRFDHYLMGDDKALTAEEKEGYALFKDNKCATCHTGVNIGGQSFEYMGIKNDYFTMRGTGLTDGDKGRFAVTNDDWDMHKFKTPTLRNIMITQPYLHDGSVESIEEAVQIMTKFQANNELTQEQTGKIIAFLNTLTGEYNGKLLK